jgi:hypothetical protein
VVTTGRPCCVPRRALAVQLHCPQRSCSSNLAGAAAGAAAAPAAATVDGIKCTALHLLSRKLGLRSAARLRQRGQLQSADEVEYGQIGSLSSTWQVVSRGRAWL